MSEDSDRAPLEISGDPDAPAQSQSARVAVNSFWLALDNLLGIIGGFGASILVARFFGPTLVGYYAFVMWIVILTSTATGRGGLVVALRKFLTERLAAQDYAGARLVLRRYSRMLLGVTTVCTVLAAVVVYFTVEPAFYLPAGLALASLFPSVYIAVATGANAALEDFSSNVKASVIANIVNLSGIALTLALGGELAGLTGALLASRIADFAVREFYRHRNYAPIFQRVAPGAKLDPETAARLKAEVLSFFAQAAVLELVTLIVWDRSELFFLKYFGPVEQIAFYSLAFSIVMQADMIPRILFIASSTALIRQNVSDPLKARRMVATIVRLNALVAVPISLGIAALADPLVRILYGKAYLAAIPVLAVLGAFGLVRPFLLPVRSYLVALSRQDLMLRALLAASIVDVGLMFILIRYYGAVGAAWCNGIAQLCGVSLSWLLLYRIAPIPIEWSRLFRILACSIVMASLVAILSRFLPPVGALLAGPLAGGCVYLLLLRATRAMDPEDRDRLLAVAKKIPGPARGLFSRSVRFAAAG